MRELSLFTGTGGGLLGTKLLGWRHIGYVEKNDYCQQVLARGGKGMANTPWRYQMKTFLDGAHKCEWCGKKGKWYDAVDNLTTRYHCCECGKATLKVSVPDGAAVKQVSLKNPLLPEPEKRILVVWDTKGE